jgi:uncharacterized membrane protein
MTMYSSATGHCLSDAEPPIFSAHLRPHRSVSPSTTRRLILTMAAICIVTSALLIWAGFWPAIPFLMFNVIALAVALHFCCRNRRSAEFILVDRSGVWIRRLDRHQRVVADHRIPLFGLTLERDTDVDFGLRELRLSLRGQAVEIARDLAPCQRAEFADAFERAMRVAGCTVWRRDRVVRAFMPSLA